MIVVVIITIITIIIIIVIINNTNKNTWSPTWTRPVRICFGVGLLLICLLLFVLSTSLLVYIVYHVPPKLRNICSTTHVLVRGGIRLGRGLSAVFFLLSDSNAYNSDRGHDQWVAGRDEKLVVSNKRTVGCHYLSNATCLTRPQLFCACFVVSRTSIICHSVRHV